jgi:hypothetical protein
MQHKDAYKVDVIIKKLKIAGNASVASEAEREARLVLEYLIEF